MIVQKADIARVLIGQNVRDKPGPCNKDLLPVDTIY